MRNVSVNRTVSSCSDCVFKMHATRTGHENFYLCSEDREDVFFITRNVENKTFHERCRFPEVQND